MEGTFGLRHGQPDSSVLTFTQVERLVEVIKEPFEVHGTGNFPTLLVPICDLIREVCHRIQESGLKTESVKVNGGLASHILAASDLPFNDIDLIFNLKLGVSCKNFEIAKNAVLDSLLEFLPSGAQKSKLSRTALSDAYVRKMVKVTDHDLWSLISLNNNTGRYIELKFVDRMRRQFEFSVDSFQIHLNSILIWFDTQQQGTSSFHDDDETEKTGQIGVTVKSAVDADCAGVAKKSIPPLFQASLAEHSSSKVAVIEETGSTKSHQGRTGRDSGIPSDFEDEEDSEMVATLTNLETNTNTSGGELQTTLDGPNPPDALSIQITSQLSGTDSGTGSAKEGLSDIQGSSTSRSCSPCSCLSDEETGSPSSGHSSTNFTLSPRVIPRMSPGFYPTVMAVSLYGDFERALYHLDQKLIDTRRPEEIRGGGLLKYCKLLVKGYRSARSRDGSLALQRYMCSRFFIDFPEVEVQEVKLRTYLSTHFFGGDPTLKHEYLSILYGVVSWSTICLMAHERHMTLAMIDNLACEISNEMSCAAMHFAAATSLVFDATIPLFPLPAITNSAMNRSEGMVQSGPGTCTGYYSSKRPQQGYPHYLAQSQSSGAHGGGHVHPSQSHKLWKKDWRTNGALRHQQPEVPWRLDRHHIPRQAIVYLASDGSIWVPQF